MLCSHVFCLVGKKGVSQLLSTLVPAETVRWESLIAFSLSKFTFTLAIGGG